MRRFWAQSLWRQLLIAIVLLLVPVLAAAVWSGWATYRERTDDLRTQTRAFALTTAAWVNRDLEVMDRMAMFVGGLSAVQQLDPARTSDMLRSPLLTRSAVIDILLARPDGSITARARNEALDSGKAWVARVMHANNRVIVPIDAPQRAPQHVLLGYPVKDASGRTVAALGILITMQPLQNALAALPLPEGSVVAITDQESRILARTRDADRTIGEFVTPGQRSLAESKLPEERDGVDGVHRMYADVVADGGPWLVSVGIPTSVAWRKAVSLWARSSAVLMLGLGGWLIVAIVLSRRLTDAVGHLDSTAQRIAKGDFSPMTHRPTLSREFTELQTAFDAMLRRFNETRTALDSQMAEERRIRQELESLQGQVIRQERLAAVGQLVSGVAHEINNPLQAILGFAELLQMQSDVPESVKADLRLIQKESARACGIIRNLALFARQQPGAAAPVRLVDVITSVAELRLRRLQSEDIDLRIDDRSRQPVMAVVTELQQVLLNFVVNAEQAIVTSGRLPGRITVRTYDRDGQVLLEVEDTGPGIPAENEAKLFQPFFTTKPVGQGTGLGLSVSYGIVDSMGGRIGYRRAAAGGAIFYFELPAAVATHV
jgi:C4-dicarboxylate-specific signal transduction histidine kinase